MTTSARWNTRRLYKFESEFFRGNFLNRPRSIVVLRLLAAKIWRAHSIRGQVMPRIVCGRGVLYNGSLYSYYQEDDKIVLARNQRTIPILLHELVHALGYDDHDRMFVDAYFRLLREYASLTWWEVMRARIKYKI